MNTTAAVAHSARGPFVIEPIELPELQPTEVLVRIAAVGICHTDLASRDGQLPAPFPAVFGHEGSGVVEQAGNQVTTVVAGDHVVLAPDSDGTCRQCQSGAPTYCDRFLELNFQASADRRTARLADGRPVAIKYFGQSSFAHHAVVSQRSVVKVPRDLPLRLLGPLGCSIQTGAGTVMNRLRPRPGSSIAVLGLGAVGMAAILGASASGCTTIIAVDRNQDRLDLARRVGATHAVDTTDTPDLGGAIHDVLPSGVDFIVDAAGVPALITTALTGLARRGTLALVAVPPTPDRTLALPWLDSLLRGQTVTGVIEGNSIPDIFIPRMIELFAQGRFPFDKLASFYPFSKINCAIEDQLGGRAIKPILEMDHA